MKGSPAKLGTIQGTAGHSSALKMRVEADAASALKYGGKVNEPTSGPVADVLSTVKDKKVKKDPNIGKKGLYKSDMSWKEGETKAKSEGSDLNALTKQRKGLKKGSFEYNKVQNKINSALGNKKRYDEGPAAEPVKPTKKDKIVAKGTQDRVDIVDKAEEKGGEDVDYKAERKLVKSQQQETKKLKTADVKIARAKYGRGSDEVKAAKAKRRANRKADRVERRTMRKDQRANKATEKASKAGATTKQKDRATRLTKKADDYASTTHEGKLIGD